MFGGHAAGLLFENSTGPHTEDQNREREKPQPRDASHEGGHPENASSIAGNRAAHVSSVMAGVRRGAISRIGSRPIVSRTASIPAPRLPVVSPTRSATNPAVIGIAESVRTTQ